MKILYGVQGTGNGHFSRARAMSQHFSRTNATVDYLFSGRLGGRYFNMEPFGDYRVRSGLTFAAMDGRIRYWQTVINSQPVEFLRDVRQLNVDDYDVILTDFEPVTAWAGKLRKKTVIALGHQPAFRYAVPKGHGRGRLVSSQVLKYFAPGTVLLGMHWHHFGQPLLPPIVPAELEPDNVAPGKILVYLPSENLQSVTELLGGYSNHEFYIYSPACAKDGDQGNIHLRKISLQGFRQDLMTCEGVICNAGFETPSECLQIGKKVLVKPVLKQMEQVANAVALDTLGLGKSMETLNKEVIEAWLMEKQQGHRVVYPDVAKEIVQWVLAGDWRDVAGLSRKLWSQTGFGEGVGVTPSAYT